MKDQHECTRQNVLNKLYNQDIAPEDSEITSFYYHKTLALQCLIAAFSLCSVVLTLVSYVYKSQLAPQILKRSYNLLLIFTMLGVLGIILKKISEMKWIQEKKQKNITIHKEVIMLLLEVLLYLPCPTSSTDATFSLTTYDLDTKHLNYNSFISFYLLFNRFLYIIIFLIHSELFYGSRPDRLSRLYTVKFGTFNAIKFLINEKPGSVVKATFSFNFIVLPFAMLLIEGEINKFLSSFHSCLYFVVVTQATVGYGDIVPTSIFGRVVTLLIIMAGVTNTALLLILFMRLMDLRGEEEESLYLLESLEKKVNLIRSRVCRIQNEWIYSNMRCPPEAREEKEQEIRAIRYNLRRNIMLDRVGPINVKRMMLSNFSEIVQNLNVIREKNNIISRCIEVIKNSQPNSGDAKAKENMFSKLEKGEKESAREKNPILKTYMRSKGEKQRSEKENSEHAQTPGRSENKELFFELINDADSSQKVLAKGESKTTILKNKISGFMYENS